MHNLGSIIALIGTVLMVVGGIWFLVRVFRDSILWGILCLITGVASLIYLILNWQVAKKPAGMWLLGTIIAAVGAFLRGDFGH